MGCASTRYEHAACLQHRFRDLVQLMAKMFSGMIATLHATGVQYVTSGMLSIPDVLTLLLSDMDSVFEIQTIHRAKCCEEAVARIAMFSSRFRKRLLVVVSALQAA